jgi:hypothetical protein
MIVATFNASTGWAGKCITREGEYFILEGYGGLRAVDVMQYDAAGQIDWHSDGMRALVGSLAAGERAQEENPIVPPKESGEARCIGSCVYLGGHPDNPTVSGVPRRLWVTRYWIGVEESKKRPLGVAVPTSALASVSLDSRQVTISRVPAVLAFGVFGLAAKGAEDRAYLIATMKDGHIPTYELRNANPFALRALIAPILALAGVPTV